MSRQIPYQTILITGGAGFVGSNLCISFKKKNPSVKIIALDNLSRRGSELNLERLKIHGVDFIHGDIRNPEDLDLKDKTDLVIECSAEPSVLSGYNESPAYVINTNLIGMVNCLELVRQHHADIVFLSTSRVYPYDAVNNLKTEENGKRLVWIAEQGEHITGWTPNGIDVDFTLTGPRSMYGATKLCAEILLQEYINMYGIRGIINRCGVIAGPWQFGKVDQGVFTLWMLSHYFKRPLKYIGFNGKGKQVRDVLHVEDLFSLIDQQLRVMDRLNGEIFNIGGGFDRSLSLIEATELCHRITDNRIDIHSDPENRPADIAIYITDNNKATSTTLWTPQKTAEDILEDIFNWISRYEKPLQTLLC